MLQRRSQHAEADDEMKRFLQGISPHMKRIDRVLDLTDPLTRQLVLFRAAGGDYRQACRLFSISETTYYARLRLFRKMLMTAINSDRG